MVIPTLLGGELSPGWGGRAGRECAADYKPRQGIQVARTEDFEKNLNRQILAVAFRPFGLIVDPVWCGTAGNSW